MPDANVLSLLDAADAFSGDLRLGNDFNEAQYQALCRALTQCSEAWRELDAIPRGAVNVLVDMHLGIESCFGLHSGQELERIREALLVIDDLVRACVALRPKDDQEYPIS